MEQKGYKIVFYLSIYRFGMYNDSIRSATYRTQPSVHSACFFPPTRRARTRNPFKKVTLGIKSGKDKFYITKKLTNS